ncbi:MAG: polysaccharide biosynthesis C-terminal domain-containing protein [Oscillospiraceae bacterium]|nr:polysaccharide biosynthesis C-terminal domain-containing protein [Oscillospiraceae bacterium]
MKYKNGVLSAVIGILQQLLTLTFGLIVPRLFIRTFGSEMNGFLGSIGNLYSYLALVEAGVGTAAIQALWGPLGRNDRRTINEIMAATAVWYTKAGFIYLLGVFLISILYPLTVKSTIPFWTIFTVSMLSGAGGVINFWVQGKYMVLLQAEGKKYVMSLVTMAVYIATNIIKIVMLLNGYDVVAIHIGYFTVSLCQMLFYQFYIKKNYQWLDLHVASNKKALKQSNAVFVQEIARMVCQHTDILVLTYVAQDLKAVSVYSVYLMVFSTVQKLFTTFFGSFHYLLGQKYNNDKEGYMPMHRVYEATSMAGSFALYTIAFLMITPFMKVYTAGITDAQYVDKYLPFLFVLMHIMESSREASSRVINFAGHFKQMQWRAVLEAVINLTASILLVYKLGIYGVVLGTIVAFLWRTNDIILYANKYLLHRSCWQTYKIWLLNIAVFALCWFASTFVDLSVNSIPHFFLKGSIVGIAVFLVYFTELRFFHKESALFLVNVGKKVLRKIKLKKA